MFLTANSRQHGTNNSPASRCMPANDITGSDRGSANPLIETEAGKTVDRDRERCLLLHRFSCNLGMPLGIICILWIMLRVYKSRVAVKS